MRRKKSFLCLRYLCPETYVQKLNSDEQYVEDNFRRVSTVMTIRIKATSRKVLGCWDYGMRCVL